MAAYPVNRQAKHTKTHKIRASQLGGIRGDRSSSRQLVPLLDAMEAVLVEGGVGGGGATWASPGGFSRIVGVVGNLLFKGVYIRTCVHALSYQSL